ncbi:MAG: ribulose-phosphate 3-epimerase [Clostridiales bacterium]|nr:ribulose-phosphate 3-epimerase [Clostridiales bacterium]
MIKVSVSSLIYNDNILEMLNTIIDSGADFLHLDIMDGSLTENKTFLADTVKQINKNSTFFLDCHLMINEPKDIVKDYVKAGANIVTVHFEAFENKQDLLETLQYLKNKNVIVGLSIYPTTKIEDIILFENYFDLLLIMSVEIGKYGQNFINSTLDKIIEAKTKLKYKLIEVDGGINLNNIELIKNAGADIVVVGSSFKNAEEKNEFITNLKK